MLSYLVPIVLLILLIAASIRILPEYKRGVVFFLGRFLPLFRFLLLDCFRLPRLFLFSGHIA